jgi:hypothetical protein
VVATIAAVAAVGAGGLAVGAVPDAKDRIVGCYVTSGSHQGTLRLLVKGKRCASGERRLAWNRRGLPGSIGATGPRGLQGLQGPTGQAGPSEGFDQGLFPGGPGLSLQAGSYVVHATVQASNTGGAAQDVTCTLSIGSASDNVVAKDIKTVTIAAGAKAVIPLHQIHQLAAPGPANVSCEGLSSFHGLMTALRVGTVHEI